MAEQAVIIRAGEVSLEGDLKIPPSSKTIVAFAHGSGSSRKSLRNRYVAEVLNEAGLGTLLFDLLTRREEAEDMITGRLRFDIEFLAGRLVAATDWLKSNPDTAAAKLGYFGASTGAAAALVAAVERPDEVAAIVSRGGRPDLAAPFLRRVKAPTLRIVGGDDKPVIDMNREALAALDAEKRLEIVPDASHLFEEPGTLEEVARLAAAWFTEHLSGV